MKISKKHLFVLFSLIGYLKKVNRRFKNKPLEASVSKIDFIRFIQSSKISEKSQRGLYKNLEILEKKKLIEYGNRFLKLTKRGLTKARDIEMEIKPYLDVMKKLESSRIKTGAAQTYFK